MPFSVIVPSRNAANLNSCVDALRAAGETCRVIVIDNGLTDRRDDCEYVDYDGPFVYAKAVNLGIQAAGTDDVLICGDDTRLLSKRGYSLLSEMSRWVEGLGILSASYTDACGNRNQLCRSRKPMEHCYGKWNRAVQIVSSKTDVSDPEYGSLVRRVYSELGGTGLRPEPRMLCFIAVYVPRSTIELVGYMDQRFTSYGSDDSDMSLRVRRHGLSLWVTGDVIVEHGVLPSEFRSKKSMDERSRNLASGREIFERKWGFAETGHW